MILAGVVEGVGPRSGRIDLLRIICSESEVIERLQAIRAAESWMETPGSLMSMASKTVFKEQLSDTLRCWTHRANRRLSLAA